MNDVSAFTCCIFEYDTENPMSMKPNNAYKEKDIRQIVIVVVVMTDVVVVMQWSLLLFSAVFCAAKAKGTSTSSISFCVSDGYPSHLFYLSDLSTPLPGQSVVLDEYNAGRLVLSGVFLPDPRVVLSSANRKYSASANIEWNKKSHIRSVEYTNVLERLQRKVRLDSSALLSVVPMGLAGSTNSEEKMLTAVADSRRSEEFTVLSSFFSRPSVPRLWPTLLAAIQNAANREPGFAKGESEMQYASHVARFVVSLHRFKIEVVDEEDHYIQSAMLVRQRKQARESHPDLRDGQLRADLPLAFISQIDYGHRLVVSANITIPVDSKRTVGDDRIGHNLMRVVAKDLKAKQFQAMFPGAVILARFRWDPDVPIPHEAIAQLNRLKLATHGDWPGAWNASLMMCPRGSFRRSRDGLDDHRGTCPAADEWPDAGGGSWVMRGGDASALKARVEEWRQAMTQAQGLAAHAVPLAVQVRRSPSAADTAQLQEHHAARAKAAVGGDGRAERWEAGTREVVRERRVQTYVSTRCLRSSSVPLALMMAAGDLAVLLAFTLVLLLMAWVYLVGGFVLARLAAHVRLPPFLTIHTFPLRLHFVTLGTPHNT